MGEPTTSGKRKIIVLTAPSGSGKTTIARAVMAAFPQIRFSVSATTRPARPHEQHGKDYYFVSQADFRRHIANGDLLEYEEVYPGRYYGTLRSEVERVARKNPVLLDIEVNGARNVKHLFDDEALVLFIQPPSLEVLAERLRARATETEETLRTRLQRAEMELAQAATFDGIVINDRLDDAVEETLAAVRSFLSD